MDVVRLMQTEDTKLVTDQDWMIAALLTLTYKREEQDLREKDWRSLKKEEAISA